MGGSGVGSYAGKCPVYTAKKGMQKMLEVSHVSKKIKKFQIKDGSSYKGSSFPGTDQVCWLDE